MNVTVFDRQDTTNPINGTTFCRRDEIMRLIDSLKGREPFFLELIGSGANNLLVGIAANSACIQHSRKDGIPPYFMATEMKDQTNEERSMNFLINNTPTPISTRYCLPIELARHVVAQFVESGRRSDLVRWEEI
jgi:Immunity protein Imm1